MSIRRTFFFIDTVVLDLLWIATWPRLRILDDWFDRKTYWWKLRMIYTWISFDICTTETLTYFSYLLEYSVLQIVRHASKGVPFTLLGGLIEKNLYWNLIYLILLFNFVSKKTSSFHLPSSLFFLPLPFLLFFLLSPFLSLLFPLVLLDPICPSSLFLLLPFISSRYTMYYILFQYYYWSYYNKKYLYYQILQSLKSKIE